MDLTKLRDINATQAVEALESTRHQELLAHDDNVAQTVLTTTIALIQFLEQQIAKIEVVNPVTSVSTPDVDGVIKALEVVNRTIAEQPQSDFSDLTTLLGQVVTELQSIPKEQPQITIPDTVTIANPVDNSKQLKDIHTAVKAIKLTAEAPVVNVPETNVHVEAPDLKPLETASKELETTIKLGQEEMREVAAKSASGLITEKFDEYKIVYAGKFDDEEETQISGINYLLNGKQVVKLRYTYDKDGNLLGGKRV